MCPKDDNLLKSHNSNENTCKIVVEICAYRRTKHMNMVNICFIASPSLNNDNSL